MRCRLGDTASWGAPPLSPTSAVRGVHVAACMEVMLQPRKTMSRQGTCCSDGQVGRHMHAAHALHAAVLAAIEWAYMCAGVTASRILRLKEALLHPQVEAAEGDSAQCQLCAALADYKAGNTSEVDAFHAYWGWPPAPPLGVGEGLLNTLLGF